MEALQLEQLEYYCYLTLLLLNFLRKNALCEDLKLFKLFVFHSACQEGVRPLLEAADNENSWNSS